MEIFVHTQYDHRHGDPISSTPSRIRGMEAARRRYVSLDGVFMDINWGLVAWTLRPLVTADIPFLGALWAGHKALGIRRTE